MSAKSFKVCNWGRLIFLPSLLGNWEETGVSDAFAVPLLQGVPEKCVFTNHGGCI